MQLIKIIWSKKRASLNMYIHFIFCTTIFISRHSHCSHIIIALFRTTGRSDMSLVVSLLLLLLPPAYSLYATL